MEIFFILNCFGLVRVDRGARAFGKANARTPTIFRDENNPSAFQGVLHILKGSFVRRALPGLEISNRRFSHFRG